MTDRVLPETKDTQPPFPPEGRRGRNFEAKSWEEEAGEDLAVEDTSKNDFSDRPENETASDRDSEPDEAELEDDRTVPSAGIEWQGLLVGLGIGAVTAIAGMQFFFNQQSPATPEVKAESAQFEAGMAQNVEVAPVEVASVDRTIEGTGTVVAYDLLPVLAQVNGLQIKQVLVKEGDAVEKGQVMAILDDSVLRAQLAEAIADVQSADATVQQAQAQVQQAQSLQNETVAAFEQAKANLVQARARALQAQAGVDKAKAGVSVAQASAAQARAQLEQAQREVERSQNLASQGVISVQDLEKRKTEAKTAQEDLKKSAQEINQAIEEVKVAEAQIINAQADIRNAEAGVSNARAKFETAGTNIGSAQANVGNNQASVRSSEARVQQLQTQLEQTLVRAPESGIIAERIVRVGDVTSASQKLYSIIRDGRLELQLKVPETQLPQIKIGTEVKLISDSDSRLSLRGNVREIAPNIEPGNRQATVKINLPRVTDIRESLLRPGMFLRASLATASDRGLTVPAKAVVPQTNGTGIVYRLVGENKVQAQSVVLGEVMGAMGGNLSKAKVEIKSGLKADDRVVVGGVENLKDGDRVNVISENGMVPNTKL